MQSPPNCCHQLSVSRSYMTRSELRSLPVVPKLKVRPGIRRSKTTEELQSGHHVTAIGVPPTVSLTISCQIMPSRPGELHPEPLTDPDLNLSIHPARAIARRLPPSIAPWVPPVAG